MGLLDWVKNLFGGGKEEAAPAEEAPTEEPQVESTESSQPADDEAVQ